MVKEVLFLLLGCVLRILELLGRYHRAEKSTDKLLFTARRVYYWRSRAADVYFTDKEREANG